MLYPDRSRAARIVRWSYLFSTNESCKLLHGAACFDRDTLEDMLLTRTLYFRPLSNHHCTAVARNSGSKYSIATSTQNRRDMSNWPIYLRIIITIYIAKNSKAERTYKHLYTFVSTTCCQNLVGGLKPRFWRKATYIPIQQRQQHLVDNQDITPSTDEWFAFKIEDPPSKTDGFIHKWCTLINPKLIGGGFPMKYMAITWGTTCNWTTPDPFWTVGTPNWCWVTWLQQSPGFGRRFMDTMTAGWWFQPYDKKELTNQPSQILGKTENV